MSAPMTSAALDYVAGSFPDLSIPAGHALADDLALVMQEEKASAPKAWLILANRIGGERNLAGYVKTLLAEKGTKS